MNYRTIFILPLLLLASFLEAATIEHRGSVSLGQMDSFVKQGNYIYVSCGDYSSTKVLTVADVSNPDNPVVVASVDDVGTYSYWLKCGVSGNYFYAYDGDSNDIAIVNRAC